MNKQNQHFLTYTALSIIAVFVFLLAMDSVAHARAGGGRSMGSRSFSSGGSYQRSAPAAPSRQPTQQPGMNRQTPTQQPTSQPGFGRSLLYGMGGGLLGGMMGNMLFGGRGYAGGGGWGGGGFGFGDFLIILIIVGIIYFVVKRFRNKRNEMAMSSAGGAAYAPSQYGYDLPPAEDQGFSRPAQNDFVSEGIQHIRSMDPSFTEDRFRETAEDMFFKIQSAWGKRDLAGVRNLLSPQMLDTFQKDVDSYIADKKINRLENVAVRQADIVYAAQNQGEEYITIKFLASLLDYTVDDSTNQIRSGSPTDPVKFLEYWTFSRKVGDKNWVLSGITQEGDY